MANGTIISKDLQRTAMLLGHPESSSSQFKKPSLLDTAEKIEISSSSSEESSSRSGEEKPSSDEESLIYKK